MNLFKNKPVPLRLDSKHLAAIQLEEGPEDPVEARQLEKRMGFNYCQAIGEAIYALTVCRVDISSSVIKLSQH